VRFIQSCPVFIFEYRQFCMRLPFYLFQLFNGSLENLSRLDYHLFLQLPESPAINA
jgi:hypothetical protein